MSSAAWLAVNKDKRKAYDAAYRAAHRSKIKATRSAYLAANKDKVKASCAAYEAANKDKRKAYRSANKNALRCGALRRKFGLTLEQRNSMLASQGGGCAICKAPDGSNNNHHGVDHDHDTGVVRGVLCVNCNSGMGKLKDSPAMLAATLRYLHRHGKALSTADLNSLFALQDAPATEAMLEAADNVFHFPTEGSFYTSYGRKLVAQDIYLAMVEAALSPLVPTPLTVGAADADNADSGLRD